MIGNSGTARRDSSFLCLLSIYAAHLLLFHVLDVAPRLPDLQQRQLTSSTRDAAPSKIGTEHNSSSTIFEKSSVSDADGRTTSSSDDLLNGPAQLRYEVLTATSQHHWDSSPMYHSSLTSYPKIDFDLLYLLTWIQRIKNIFTTIALSSSTWGIISGCAIFLLTYTDRDNTLQI